VEPSQEPEVTLASLYNPGFNRWRAMCGTTPSLPIRKAFSAVKPSSFPSPLFATYAGIGIKQRVDKTIGSLVWLADLAGLSIITFLRWCNTRKLTAREEASSIAQRILIRLGRPAHSN